MRRRGAARHRAGRPRRDGGGGLSASAATDPTDLDARRDPTPCRAAPRRRIPAVRNVRRPSKSRGDLANDSPPRAPSASHVPPRVRDRRRHGPLERRRRRSPARPNRRQTSMGPIDVRRASTSAGADRPSPRLDVRRGRWTFSPLRRSRSSAGPSGCAVEAQPGIARVVRGATEAAASPRRPPPTRRISTPAATRPHAGLRLDGASRRSATCDVRRSPAATWRTTPRRVRLRRPTSLRGSATDATTALVNADVVVRPHVQTVGKRPWVQSTSAARRRPPGPIDLLRAST
jgi:hypothetical protein